MLICGYCKQPMTVWEWMDDHRVQRCDRAKGKATEKAKAPEGASEPAARGTAGTKGE